MPFIRWVERDDSYWIRDTRGGDVREIAESRLKPAVAARARRAEPAFIEIDEDDLMKQLAARRFPVAGIPLNLQQTLTPTALAELLKSPAAKDLVRLNGAYYEVRKNQTIETKTLAGVEVFAVGTHNGDTYTLEDLEGIVAAFQALKGFIDPPVKLGHTSDEFNIALAGAIGVNPAMIAGENGGGAIALGWVSRLRVNGDFLEADFSDVPLPIIDLIEAKLFKKVSAEILVDFEFDGQTFPFVLSGVALLGAELPAVRSIDGLEGAAVFTYQYKPGRTVELDLAGDNLSFDDLAPELQRMTDSLEKLAAGKIGVVALRTLWQEVVAKAKVVIEGRHRKPRHNADLSKEDPEEDAMSKEVTDALKLAEDASPEDITAAINALADGSATAEEFKASLKQIAGMLGLEEGADKEAVLAALKKLTEVKDPDPVENKAFAAIEERVRKLSVDLTTERDGRKWDKRHAHYLTLALNWRNVAGKPEDIADGLVELEKANEKAAEAQVNRFTATNEALEAAGTHELSGGPGEGETGGKHAFVLKVEKKATADKISYADAQQALRVELPGEWNAYRKDTREVAPSAH